MSPSSIHSDNAPWIETYTGTKFYFLNPDLDSIHIEDIAHALANTCRYTGHCRTFYSVAEHSVAVSEIGEPSLEKLLHDASEAYITDIASPVKPFLSNYKELESRIMGRIAERFGFNYPFSPETHLADLTQLSIEAEHLIPSKGDLWEWHRWTPDGNRPRGGIIPRCLSPRRAEKLFLRRFRELSK